METKGAKADLRIFTESRLNIGKKVLLKGDLGYVGINKSHPNARVPFKKPKNQQLPKAQQKWNKKFRKKRVRVEHVIRRCKVFRIVKECYRNKRKNMQIIWSIICGIVNLKY